MKYNFEFAVSAQISARVVEEMVRKIVEEQTGKKVKKLDVKMGRISKGFGPSESIETVFEGFTVYFENEQAPTTNSNFKEDTYK